MEPHKNFSLENIEGEIWLPITGWEGKYEISNKGRVKSLSRRFYPESNPRTRLTPVKIHKPYIDESRGYCRAKLNINNGSIKISVHRLVAIHFIPNPENKSQVNHKNGIKTDNRDVNLEWATPTENTRHAIQMGLLIPLANLPKSTVGVNHGKARYSEQDVHDIRARYDSGETPTKIWRDYQKTGVSAINSICRRKNWKHI